MTYNPRSPRPHMRGPRPQAWVTGPDEEEHQKYRAFIQQRNQAQWRGEVWELTFDQWKQLWAEKWIHRGRTQGTYCLTRRDYNEPWTVSNAQVLSRRDHNLRQQGQSNRKPRGPNRVNRKDDQ